MGLFLAPLLLGKTGPLSGTVASSEEDIVKKWRTVQEAKFKVEHKIVKKTMCKR